MAATWRLSRLVAAFRSRGHYSADVDPLGLSDPALAAELSAERFGIDEQQLNTPVPTDIASIPQATPREIVELMTDAYCGTIGFEVMHIEDREEREWLLDRIEGEDRARPASAEQRLRALERLTDAKEMERFIHTQYIGVKRFSLEGLEALIPLLDRLLERAGDEGTTDVVIGMAHRGRLNVLVNILEKSHRELFSAFNDRDSESLVGRGDVKYHLGHSHDHVTASGDPVHITLCFNPSHLEFVDPVVVGRVRAKMDRRGDPAGRRVLPLMVHGDAAFIGQGVVVETLNLAELEGYRTGGTVHVVLNNQVGFTTSPSDGRSSRYASDIVRFLRIPVFHVNAEDIDAVLRVTQLALEYRQLFGRDVCIDLIGYRKFGHNEGDEPRFTQPKMYDVIDRKESIRDLFAERLKAVGELSDEQDSAMLDARRAKLAEALEESRENPELKMPSLSESVWDEFFGGPYDRVFEVDTRVPVNTLLSLAQRACSVPEDVNAHDKVRRIYGQRLASVEAGDRIDWGAAEMLAYATLVHEGRHVRLSGQDSRRGTFSHRHAYVVDVETGARMAPMNACATGTGRFEAFDSPLSENAVLGFEYGYSLEAPADLVIWEAQFGDFANGAQVIIDQFIVAGEDKWGRLTGLVLLLPHGFEGMGPEHSYARLGRFLALCAEDCMQVCDCTTPAQFFHLLRRQVLSPWRKPLVVMSPKSLLRHKLAVSSMADLSEGGFLTIIPDTGIVGPADVDRVLLCSGRIYFDLETERRRRRADNVHIVRLEQLYPLDAELLTEILSRYCPGTTLCWVQDEPWNMGAWYFIKARLQALFGDELPLECIARAESASPATGSTAAHRLEQRVLLDTAFGGGGSGSVASTGTRLS